MCHFGHWANTLMPFLTAPSDTKRSSACFTNILRATRILASSSGRKPSVAKNYFNTNFFERRARKNGTFATHEQRFPTNTEQLLLADNYEMLSSCALNEHGIPRHRIPNPF
jgi:hypothetical protein